MVDAQIADGDYVVIKKQHGQLNKSSSPNGQTTDLKYGIRTQLHLIAAGQLLDVAGYVKNASVLGVLVWCETSTN
jgi:hypothetical protein